MKRAIQLALAVALAASVHAAPTVIVAELTTGTWSAMSAPSEDDDLDGNLAVPIGQSTNHQGGPINLAAFTDGSDTVIYPDQLPHDYPGVNTPALKLMWDIRSGTQAVDLKEVRVYCANHLAKDARIIPIVDLYVTSDASPTTASTWILLISKARTNAPPANFDYLQTNSTCSLGGIQIEDEAAGKLAAAVTGMRVDFYASGFDREMRNPESTEPAKQAVASPWIAEVDASFSIAARVDDWSAY